MEFNKIVWADSKIEEIKIKYNELTLKVFNDALNKDVVVICKNFAGITNLCLWDDTDIYNAKLEAATKESVFYTQILKAYTDTNGNIDNSDTNRTLADGLKKLTLTLTNGITCEIYCQFVIVDEQ